MGAHRRIPLFFLAVAMDFLSTALVDGQVACIECVLYRICSLYCTMDFFSSVSWNFFFIVTKALTLSRSTFLRRKVRGKMEKADF